MHGTQNIKILTSDFPTKTLYAPVLFPLRAACPAHHSLIDLIRVLPCYLQISSCASCSRKPSAYIPSVVSLCSPVCSGNFSVTAAKQAVYTVCSRRDVESHLQVRRSTASPFELPADGSVQKLGEWLEATKEAWRTVVSLSVIRHDVMALYAGVATSVVLFVVLDAGRYVVPLRVGHCEVLRCV